MKLTDLIDPRVVRYLELTQAMYNDMKDRVKDGEILNPEFQEYKGLVSRLADVTEEGIRDKFVVAGKYQSLPEDIRYFDWGYGLQGAKGWDKRVNKIKGASRNHPMMLATMEAFEQLKPYMDMVDALKPLVVKTSAKRAQEKEVKQVALKKKFTDASSLTNVLMQHIDAYVEKAGQIAEDQIDRFMQVMEDNDWNIDQVAPEPNSRTDGREAYISKRERRQFFNSITAIDESKADPTNRWAANPWRIERPGVREQYITSNKEGAKASYLAWVHKMIEKIGKPVATADMRGDPWVNSTITVNCEDGEQQIWNSKMIINRSKYGKLFNQFPSRRKS